jgi:hypothetical protein
MKWTINSGFGLGSSATLANVGTSAMYEVFERELDTTAKALGEGKIAPTERALRDLLRLKETARTDFSDLKKYSAPLQRIWEALAHDLHQPKYGYNFVHCVSSGYPMGCAYQRSTMIHQPHAHTIENLETAKKELKILQSDRVANGLPLPKFLMTLNLDAVFENVILAAKQSGGPSTADLIESLRGRIADALS